jgi:BirA family biotin operon repressor/biotin-[acetyl-CoA-carboxylase] ligase
MACALAAARSVEDETGLRPSLKWPNDILLDGRKVGGVLLESKTARGKVEYVVVGLGINANVSRKDLPPEVRESVATLEECLGDKVNLDNLLESFLRHLAELSRDLEGEGQAHVLEAWKERNVLTGKRVAARTRRAVEGICEGIDSRGRLLIREESGRVVPCSQNTEAVRFLE